MPSIINVPQSWVDSEYENFHPGSNAVLISIRTPGYSQPRPKHKYVSEHYFELYDSEWFSEVGNPGYINEDIAKELTDILKVALDNDNDVVVHCAAGVSRSGAVCEVGEMMGFDVFGGRHRQPNVVIKKLMMEFILK